MPRFGRTSDRWSRAPSRVIDVELSLIDLRNAVVAGDAGVRRAALALLAARRIVAEEPA